MITVFDRAVKALNDVDEAIDHLADNEAYVTALAAQGLLAPDVQAIRTVEELEALDPDTALIAHDGWMRLVGFMQGNPPLANTYLPAVVIATGAQVRAAREAMEKENE